MGLPSASRREIATPPHFPHHTALGHVILTHCATRTRPTQVPPSRRPHHPSRHRQRALLPHSRNLHHAHPLHHLPLPAPRSPNRPQPPPTQPHPRRTLDPSPL